MKNCPKCGTVVKEWDLVCPHCGTTLFIPQTPVDSRKVNVSLPDWELHPQVPKQQRRPVPPRPAPARPTPADAPSFVDHSDEATDMISIADIQPPDAPGFVDHSDEATDMISIADIQTIPQAIVPKVEPFRPQAPSKAPAVLVATTPPAAARRRRKQDTMPLDKVQGTMPSTSSLETETTQPRARHPAGPAGRPGHQAEAQLRSSDPHATMNLEGYDPERLKRILAQAQAEAAARSPKDPNTTLYIVVGAILAATIIGAALVIALFI